MAENRVPFSDSRRARQFILIAAIIAAILLILGILFAGRAFDWNKSQKKQYLIELVNEDNPVDSDWSPEFTMLGDGYLVCSDCASDLEVMLGECAASGGYPKIVSAYRSESAQQRMLDTITQRLIEEGMDPESAAKEAVRGAGSPGCSEHQLGYAVDIACEGYDADYDENNSTILWLKENSWKYGFIARNIYDYSENTEAGHIPEHYRYVGTEAASQINELNITLEEYIEMFYSK